MNKKPRAAIYTLGCKVNQYESEAIAEALTAKGFDIVPFDEDAEVYIINTCTVTAESDRKACQIIRRAAKKRPDGHRPAVLVTGCMAQSQPERAGAIAGVTYVCGTRNKLSCVEKAVESVSLAALPETAEIRVPEVDCCGFEEMTINRSESDRARAYIKIEDGCENRCTYCAIPGSRGLVSSRRPDEVIREMERLADAGYREIVLTGIEIASYGADFKGDPLLNGYRLIDLLEAADTVPGVERIRLGSLEPTYMKPATVSRMAALRHLAPHFHLSLQSGADHVLHLMKRKYSMRHVRTILADIREKIPDVMFTTDIMTGFPQETAEDFAETMAFAKEAKLLHIHVFPYSRRKNTPADAMSGQLSGEEKSRRASALIAEQNEIEASIYRELADTHPTVTFLAETYEDGVVIGHTANFMEVHVRCDRDPGRDFFTVCVTGAAGSHFTAEF
ncbi:MAG: tRNA (N(6)-L-threonylcarbamoyladenosine(37)-C(2))-methylthiotransferase MtaB [Clostridia bacterium]|nr:tRNA (N(6)-L-threonylcarbamoyladenosine(37)-C(2))-methylthiotransferase MtaB [Clostridia bacterium]